MKTFKLIICTLFISWFQLYFCQDDEINLDVLRAQASPAGNLLGIANSDIEKPTDINALMVSLREGSDNFSALPTSFAIDVAPFKLNGNYQDLRNKTDFIETFKQSFVTSFAFKKIDEDLEENIEEKSRVGVGFKFSIKRGHFDDETADVLDLIHSYHKAEQIIMIKDNAKKTEELDKEKIGLLKEIKILGNDTKNPKYIALKKRIDEINKRIENLILLNGMAHDFEKIREETQKIKLERYGFFLDYSMGTVIDFRKNKFDNSQITKAGAWLTGGWNFEKSSPSSSSSSILFITRYLYNPDSPLANAELKKENLHTLDMGARYILNFYNKKFLLSGECIYRSILNKSDYEASWKFLMNFEYEVSKNQRLTFSFGRDFNGEYKKDGNVVVALNLLVGIGKFRL